MTTTIYEEFQELPQDDRARSRHSRPDTPIFVAYLNTKCQQCNDEGIFKQRWFNCKGNAVERDIPCFRCDTADKGE